MQKGKVVQILIYMQLISIFYRSNMFIIEKDKLNFILQFVLIF